MGTRTTVLQLYKPAVGEIGWGGEDKVDGNFQTLDNLFQGSGQLKPSAGGLGVDVSTAADGELLIGNGTGLSLASLTAGTGILITNGPGAAVTIASSGSPAGGSIFSAGLLIGSATGTDYTRTANTFDDVDAANLKATVTVPGGAKFILVWGVFCGRTLSVTPQGNVRVLAAGDETAVSFYTDALFSGQGLAGGIFPFFGVVANPVAGSQTIALQFRGDGVDTLTIFNQAAEGIFTSGPPNFISFQMVRPRLMYAVTN